MRGLRLLHKRAEALAAEWDPLVGIYSDGETLTVAIPHQMRPCNGWRYETHKIAGVNISRLSPKIVAETLRKILRKRGKRCAVAMGLHGVYFGDLSALAVPGASPRRLVVQPIEGASEVGLAATPTMVVRWCRIARQAGLDLDLLTAGPVALLRGLSTLSTRVHERLGILVIQYQTARFFLRCRGGSIASSFAVAGYHPCFVPDQVREWSRDPDGESSWVVFTGGAEHHRASECSALEGVFGAECLPLPPLIARQMINGEARLDMTSEISVLSAIGLASCDC